MDDGFAISPGQRMCVFEWTSPVVVCKLHTMTYAPNDLVRKGARAGLYERISEDDEGDGKGVARQDVDGRVYISEHDWSLDEAHVFCDNDISASTISNKPRPEFDRMLGLVSAGVIDVIVSRDNGRLTRRPMELEALIKLHEATGVLISTWKSGTDDLSTADGRMVARIKASVDAAEAERTSERVRRKLVERREHGLPHNGYPRFGYMYARETGYVVVEGLRKLIEDAYVRLGNGEPLQRIAVEWNAAGMTTRKGGPWKQGSLRKMLETGFAAGLVREHSNTKNSRKLGLKDYDVWRVGVHEAIVKAEVWERFKARMLGNAAEAPRRVVAVRALSGVLVCGLCQEPVSMTASSANGRRIWRCEPASSLRVHRGVAISDAKAQAAVLNWIEENISRLMDVDARAEEIAAERVHVDVTTGYEAELRDLDRRRRKIGDGFLNDVYTAEEAKERQAPIDARIAEVKALMVAAEAAHVIDEANNTVDAFVGLREAWPHLDPNSQREALRAVLRRVVALPGAEPRSEVKFRFVPAWEVE